MILFIYLFIYISIHYPTPYKPVTGLEIITINIKRKQMKIKKKLFQFLLHRVRILYRIFRGHIDPIKITGFCFINIDLESWVLDIQGVEVVKKLNFLLYLWNIVVIKFGIDNV